MGRRGRQRLGWLSGVVALAFTTVVAAPASGAPKPEFAPVDRPGPALQVPAEDLAASLRCTDDVDDATTTPVLLLAGTTVNTTDNFSWNWQPALTAAGIPWCTSDAPAPEDANQNMADIQTRGEYVTYAIRTVHERAGRKISTLGHSQGGMIARWSLRFWPDTRAMVDDVIGMAPSNHGTSAAHVGCVTPCSPAFWQQRSGSQFLAALNSHQETFAGISYTTIRTDFDQVVVPAESAALDGPGDIANLRVQDLCPGWPGEHLEVGTSNPITEAYVMDALNHDGPANLSRISPDVCQRPFMSGVNPATYPTDLLAAGGSLATTTLLSPRVAEEPPLRCYTLAAGCP
jgi:hypothetical protein